MGVVLAAALGGGAFLVFRAPPTPPETAGVVSVCNGSEKLCDRRVDQVVFPAAHNAMSNADQHWVAPNQSHPIAQQLLRDVGDLPRRLPIGLVAPRLEPQRLLVVMQRRLRLQRAPQAVAQGQMLGRRLRGYRGGEAETHGEWQRETHRRFPTGRGR